MYKGIKIAGIIITVSLAVISSNAKAKETKGYKAIHKKKNGSATTVGFRTGKEILFDSSPLIHNRQAKVHTGISNSLVLRKPINNRFAVEGGVSYSSFRGMPIFGSNNQKINSLALPATINYSLLPHHHCIHPYVGAGFQYTLNLNNKTTSPFTSDNYVPVNSQPGTGTKYINILFTQGVIFQVNTSIEINQSFHFVPCGSNRTIGIDLGVGYHFP